MAWPADLVDDTSHGKANFVNVAPYQVVRDVGEACGFDWQAGTGSRPVTAFRYVARLLSFSLQVGDDRDHGVDGSVIVG